MSLILPWEERTLTGEIKHFQSHLLYAIDVRYYVDCTVSTITFQHSVLEGK